MTGTIYSNRLGTIRDEQLSAALARLDLGSFIGATPITSGLFGQNLFLSSSAGEFVLRGAPHWVDGVPNDQWQFQKEMFFARLLHEQTGAPVPWPQLYDEGDDIFGWPYLVMPRLPGLCLNDQTARGTLSPPDQQAVAGALGTALAELQRLRWPSQGEVDATIKFADYPDGYPLHIATEISNARTECTKHGSWTKTDTTFIDPILRHAEAVRRHLAGTYVHADFKLDNLALTQTGGCWHVSGIFDFHTSCFGDGLADICRQSCAWLDQDEGLARRFIQSWRTGTGATQIDPDLLTLYLIGERLKIWEYFTRPGHRADWTLTTTFREFVQRYLTQLLALAATTDQG